MQARVRTVAFQGVDVVPVDVQVLIAPGTLAFAMVGLADKAVGESRERVRAALRALGLSLPMSATIPAPHAERFRIAEASGAKFVSPPLFHFRYSSRSHSFGEIAGPR